MDTSAVKVKIASALKSVDSAAWNALANPAGTRFDPFISWEFLEAMESSGAATPRTGWQPQHVLIEDAAGKLIAAMPMYAKGHSRGEFVFDQGWAEALQRAGGQYYPKLLIAVPFTPVTGRRRFVQAGEPAEALKETLLSAAVQLAEMESYSSVHFNFLEASETQTLSDHGLLLRNDQQFHWTNNYYSSFDDFLTALSSEKRKNLRKERAKAQAGLQFRHLTGDEITEAVLDHFFAFYTDTGNRKWGSPYLTRKSFSILRERLAKHMLFIFAEEGGVPIAGALNFIGSDTLYGRYWGTTDARPMLHFETCYYQAIDFAIARGLSSVEAGAQGDHKLARGYGPVLTHSAHWIAHPGLHSAVANYLEDERRAIDADFDFLKDRTPFRKTL